MHMPALKDFLRIVITAVLFLAIAGGAATAQSVKVMTYNVDEGTDFDAIVALLSNPTATAADFQQAVEQTIAEGLSVVRMMQTYSAAHPHAIRRLQKLWPRFRKSRSLLIQSAAADNMSGHAAFARCATLAASVIFFKPSSFSRALTFFSFVEPEARTMATPSSTSAVKDCTQGSGSGSASDLEAIKSAQNLSRAG
jgi:hypothetical protein